VRTYEFVLGSRFVHERNVSTYPPQEKNKSGEVHEHWSFLSYDRARQALRRTAAQAKLLDAAPTQRYVTHH
jgi:hypothetical protein